jgi:hypothetical protein
VYFILVRGRTGELTNEEWAVRGENLTLENAQKQANSLRDYYKSVVIMSTEVNNEK